MGVYTVRRAVVLFGGWMLVAVAISVLIRIDFGAAPYDVLNVGVGKLVGVAPGTAMWLTGTVLVVLAWLLGERPGLATPLGFLAIGQMVNTTLAVLPEIDALTWRLGFLVASLGALYFGVCLTIVSRLGAGPTEVFMLALVRRGMSLRASRWSIEVGCAVFGALAGGPIGVLTATIVLVAGPVIGILLPRVDRLTGLEHGAAAP